MRSLSILLAVLAVSHLAVLTAAAPPAAAAVTKVGETDPACVWNGFDLSGMVGQYAKVPAGPNESYENTVCASLAAVANTCNPSGNDASACLDISFGTQQDVFTILGYWTQNDGADWAYINNDDGGAGIMYTLTGDSTCEDNSGQMAPWLTNVQFPCASEVSVTTAAISGCTVTFSWPTPLSCKPTGPSTPPPGHDKDGGISGGTVAAIIITLLLVFGLVGALLWWLNKNGKLERVKAAFGGSGAHERLLDNGGQLQV